MARADDDREQAFQFRRAQHRFVVDRGVAPAPTTVGKRTRVDTVQDDVSFDPAGDALYRAQIAEGCTNVLTHRMLPAIDAQMRALEVMIRERPSDATRAVAAELQLALANASIQARYCDVEAQHALAVIEQRAKALLAAAAPAMMDGPSGADPVQVASRGLAGPSTSLPFQSQIQASFGPHDVSGIRAHVGGAAAEASAKLGAEAYAIGDAIAFRSSPDLHTAAHEAAHVFQQRAGVHLAGGIDGGAGDVHEQHADAVADLVVRGHSAAALLSAMPSGGATAGAVVQRKSTGGTGSEAPAGEKEGKADEGPIALLPGQTAAALKVQVGHGAVTGSIGLTMAVGTTGVPIGTERVKALQEEAKIKLNGFAAELETSVLTGNLEVDVIEGVTVTLKFSAFTVGSDGAEVSTDLVSIGAGLEGDITKWFGAPIPGFSCKLEGTVQIALGAKLAEKLTELAAKEREEQLFASELESAGTELADHEREIARLEARRAALEVGGASHEMVYKVEEQIFEHRAEAMARKEAVDELGHRLLLSRQAASGIAERMEGAVARRVAKMMERKAVKAVAEKIAHVIPFVNVAMYAIDAIQVIRKVHELVDAGHFGITDSPLPPEDEHPAKKGAANAPASEAPDSHGANASAGSTSAGPSNANRGGGDASRSGRHASQDRGALEAARSRLSPAARAVLAAITQGGRAGPGVELTPGDIAKLGALVPGDLSADEIRQIVATLQRSGPRAEGAADVLREVERAVQAVRAKQPSATIDDPQGGPGDGAITEPRQVDDEPGPITAPGQVSGAKVAGGEPNGAARPRAIDDPQTIVESAPPQVIARWFVEKDGDLIPSPELERWKAEHENSKVGGAQLRAVEHGIERLGDGRWRLEIVFKLDDPTRRRAPVRHHFFVEHGPASSLGGQAGSLSFEPYATIGRE